MHAHISCGLSTTRYCPCLLVRQGDGQAWHPSLPAPPDPDFPLDLMRSLLVDQGFDLSPVYGDEDAAAFSEEALDSCDLFEKCFAAWQPQSPPGSGWMLIAVLDSLEGPVAWFVRPFVPAIEVTRQADSSAFSSTALLH